MPTTKPPVELTQTSNEVRNLLAALLRAADVVSATPPANPYNGMRWFDSTTAQSLTFYGSSWVETAGSPAPEVTRELVMEVIGVEGGVIDPTLITPPETLTAETIIGLIGASGKISPTYLPDISTGAVLSVAGATYNLTASAAFRYLRRTHTAAMSLTVQLFSAGTGPYAYPDDCVVPIRNASTSFNLTLSAVSGVTLNYAAGRNIVGPLEDALLRRVGNTNTWDVS